jgi:hypothetical protein
MADQPSLLDRIAAKGWVLVALLCGVMILFSTEMYFSTMDPSEPISGSLCCNGDRFETAPTWTHDYAGELAKYMGTFTFGMGVFGMALVLVPLRRREPWAWVVLWYIPVLFAIHGFALGSFPFDIGPLVLTTLGLLLMARPVFAGKEKPDPSREYSASARL